MYSFVIVSLSAVTALAACVLYTVKCVLFTPEYTKISIAYNSPEMPSWIKGKDRDKNGKIGRKSVRKVG